MGAMPDWRAEVRARISGLDLPPADEADLIEEIAQHLEDQFAELSPRIGVASALATLRAEVDDPAFLESAGERVRLASARHAESVTTMPPMGQRRRGGGLAPDMIRQDLRYAARQLRRSPGFAATAVLSLAVGIGLTTTAFSIIDSVRHPLVAFTELERLRRVELGGDRAPVVHFKEMYVALRERLRSAESIALSGWGGFAPVGVGGMPVRSRTSLVSTNLLSVLGTHPLLGRDFRRDERDTPATQGVLVSYRFWRRYLGAKQDIGSIPVMIGGESHVVIGVLPPGAGVGGRRGPNDEPEVMIPMSRAAEERGEGIEPFGAVVVVRLRSGASPESLEADLKFLTTVFVNKYNQETRSSLRFHATDLAPPRQEISDFHLALSGAAVAVLLIACANVANLMVARVVTRRRDIAVRMALGASHLDVARYIVGEALLISFAGGLTGALLALWGMRVVTYQLSARFALLGDLMLRMNWRIMGFTVGVAAGTAVLVAAASVVRAGATKVNEAMKDGAGTTTSRSRGLYRWLVVAEVAISLMVLVGAALLARATVSMTHFDFGYDPRHLWRSTMQIDFRLAPDSAVRALSGGAPNGRALTSRDLAQMSQAMVAGVSGLPFVRSVATSAGGCMDRFSSDAGQKPREIAAWGCQVVSPNYLRFLGVPMLRGRDFEDGDAADTAGVAIVDDSVARLFWPSESPIGHRVKLGPAHSTAPWVRVVGVARNVPTFRFDPGIPTDPALYVVRTPQGDMQWDLLVRTASDEAAGMGVLTRYLSSFIPDMRVENITPETRLYEQQVAIRAFLAMTFSTIAAFALALAAVGLYSVLAYTGAQRTREYAMRIALGARSPDLIRMVLREAFILVLAGTALGGLLAMWAGQLMYTWLYDVYFVDAPSLVAAEAVLIIISVTAALGPALRATRANPVDLLRAT